MELYKKVGTIKNNNSVDYNIYGGTNGFTKEDSTIGKAWFFSTIESRMEWILLILVMDLLPSLSDIYNT